MGKVLSHPPRLVVEPAKPMTVIDLVERHKLVRRLALLWAVVLITWVVLRVFGGDLAAITTPVATATGLVVGLLATVVRFYQHSRAKEDQTGGAKDVFVDGP